MAVTAQQASIERTRKGYAAFDSGDVQAVIDLLADDIVWHIDGKSKYAGTYQGKQAVLELFGRLVQDGLQQKHDLHDVLANDQHIVTLSTVTATYQGRSVSAQTVDVAHENAEGQLTEFWRVSAGQADFDALVGA
jgi:ketosteroid isomerase-like protein